MNWQKSPLGKINFYLYPKEVGITFFRANHGTIELEEAAMASFSSKVPYFIETNYEAQDQLQLGVAPIDCMLRPPAVPSGHSRNCNFLGLNDQTRSCPGHL